jgi:preprotein translocase subunit SecE
MAMNRETKRMLQRQGTVDADGAPVAQRRPAPTPRPAEKEQRTTVRQFTKEVRSEMRKVAWPTRPEVVNYSVIVLLAVVLLTAYVAGLDYLFGEFILKLFSQ